MNFKCLFCGALITLYVGVAEAVNYVPENISASISLKVPGNVAERYSLNLQQLGNNRSSYLLEASESIPVTITQRVADVNGKLRVNVCITALEDIYFNYSQRLSTGYRHDDCQFYMPGFWYRRNLRSPKDAPSFHSSDSWLVREDRLSAPLTGVYSEKEKHFVTVSRIDKFAEEALSTHREGEIILSGKTSLGFTGFENQDGITALSFGFPYREAPKSYIRKLTLAPAVEAFQFLKKGETVLLTWEIQENKADDYSDFIRHAWEYSYDTYGPKPVETPYSITDMKQVLSGFFISSFVEGHPLVYNSGIHLMTENCQSNGQAEVGFIGRVLLNAFNAWEYGHQSDREDLKANSMKVFDSYLKNGFTPVGFFKESVDFDKGYEDPVHSIRRQSEGIYAMLHFLAYEKENGRRHPEWEQKMKNMLDILLRLQQADGSFPRKFRDDFTIVDTSGVWDVPFAQGQMLGDIGLKTRGWGNVSVENNHIDVFVFEFASVLRWLSKEYAEPRFSQFAEVISTSMRQLLPHEGHLCGVAKPGYYPEVVQHTNWDYGKNGKGYYNDIFAPGWTVASLWELFTPGRAEYFLK